MRKLVPAVMSALLIVALSGCGGAANPGTPAASGSAPAWSIAIEGLDQETTFTNLDMEKIGTVKVKAAVKQKDTMDPAQEWTGVPLARVLEHLGVAQYTAVKVESADGASSRELTPDIAGSDGTLLGVEVDGAPLDSERGPVQLVVDGRGDNWQIRNVAKITIIQ